MNGVLEGKAGNWYEEDYVVYQLLRLLCGEVSRLKWDGIGSEYGNRIGRFSPTDRGALAAPEVESGIDVLLREGERTIAVQIKHRTGATWPLSELRDVLRYARLALEREGPGSIDEFRFFSDARSPDLEAASRLADAAGAATAAEKKRLENVLVAMGFQPADESQYRDGLAVCRRLRSVVVGEEPQRGTLYSLAGLLAQGPNPGLLLSSVREFAKKHVGQWIDRTLALRFLESSGVVLKPDIDGRRTAAALENCRADFLEGVAQAARALPSLPEITPPEVDRIVERCANASPGTTIVVHGPAGCGKSTILAATLEKLSCPVLALRADDDLSGTFAGVDPIGALRRFCGEGQGIVLIDQLDQLFAAGTGADEKRVSDWIRQTRTLRLVLVAGCRSVDAERDTRLRKLLGAMEGSEVVRIPVEDLPEPVVETALASRGIAAGDLGRGLLQLLRRPLALALFLDLRRDIAAASRCRTILDLMSRWWERVARRTHPDAETVLDQLCDFLQERGTLTCPALQLSTRHPQALDGLVEAGVLLREGSQRAMVRPFHQLLTDARIAVRWGTMSSFEAVLAGLGSRQAQGLAQARRLRLATPLLAERPEVLERILSCEAIRPLLKRALLCGLAEFDDPSPDIVALVSDWSSRPALARRILQWVLFGNPTWARLLEARINAMWHADPAARDSLLRFLVSIDEQAPDQVDRHLKEWSAGDPHVLVRARLLFRDDPVRDSDERFDERLRFERLVGRSPISELEWDELLTKHPARAIRLFDTRVRRCPPSSFVDGDPAHQTGLPRRSPEIAVTAGVGARLWETVADWWTGLGDIELVKITCRDDEDDDGADEGVLVGAVDFIASAIAVDLGGTGMDLHGLLSTLPDPLRDLDAWLLLATMARLPEDTPEEVADGFAEWFISDPRWACTEIGLRRFSYDLRLPARALSRLGTVVSDHGYRRLEAFLAEYPDEWTVEAEKLRGEAPNRRGRIASTLLPALPAGRRSGGAERFLGELRRKFGGDGKSSALSWGTVRAAVPDRVLETWEPKRWVKELLATPPRGELRSTNGEWSRHSLPDLVARLRSLAQRDPSRFLAVAQVFDSSTPGSAREAVLLGLGTRRPPDGLRSQEVEWSPLEDAQVAELLERDAYLNEPACRRAIAWTVMERCEYSWPTRVLDRLREIAMRPDSKPLFTADPSIPGSLATFRLNDEACVAAEALVRVARHHAAPRPDLLRLAASLAVGEDSGRRASAAVLAMACESVDPVEARRVLLGATEEPATATEIDVARCLFRLCANPDAGAGQRESAKDRLLALTKSTNPRARVLGGDALFALRVEALIDDSTFSAALALSLDVRRGTASALIRTLRRTDRGGSSRVWILDLILHLCDQADPVGEQILEAFRDGSLDFLLDDRGFLARLLETRAARNNRDPLIKSCDRRGDLVTLAPTILAIVNAEASSTFDTWHGNEADAVGILSRLVEDAEIAGNSRVRTEALDAWDRLLESRDAASLRFNLDARLAG